MSNATISYRYFIGEKAESKKLTDIALAHINEKREIADKIAKEHGAEAAVRGRSGKIIGIAFKQEVSLPYLKYEGRVGYDNGPENSDPWYSPRKNRKEGKALAAAFEAAPAVPTFSEFALAHLGLKHSAFGVLPSGRPGMANAAAGLGQDGQILIKIPTTPETADAAVFSRIPAWVREVKESEILAAQGR